MRSCINYKFKELYQNPLHENNHDRGDYRNVDKSYRKFDNITKGL